LDFGLLSCGLSAVAVELWGGRAVGGRAVAVRLWAVGCGLSSLGRFELRPVEAEPLVSAC